MSWTLIFAIIGALFGGGIFLLALISFLLSGVNKILDAKLEPIKKDLANHVTKIDKVEQDTKELKDGQADLKAKIDLLLKNQDMKQPPDPK